MVNRFEDVQAKKARLKKKLSENLHKEKLVWKTQRTKWRRGVYTGKTIGHRCGTLGQSR